MKRMGRRHCPTYRLAAVDVRASRDGRVLEELGSYDPNQKDRQRQAQLKTDRIQYWLSVGAQPSETVRDLLKREGVAKAGGSVGSA
jgi:small subunit ribosomal protein S16